MIIPDPKMFDGWEAWGRAVGEALEPTDAEIRPIQLPLYGKADLPPAVNDGLLVYVVDDIGGAVPAFSEGGQWLRVTDRAIIS